MLIGGARGEARVWGEVTSSPGCGRGESPPPQAVFGKFRGVACRAAICKVMGGALPWFPADSLVFFLLSAACLLLRYPSSPPPPPAAAPRAGHTWMRHEEGSSASEDAVVGAGFDPEVLGASLTHRLPV